MVDKSTEHNKFTYDQSDYAIDQCLYITNYLPCDFKNKYAYSRKFMLFHEAYMRSDRREIKVIYIKNGVINRMQQYNLVPL